MLPAGPLSVAARPVPGPGPAARRGGRGPHRPSPGRRPAGAAGLVGLWLGAAAAAGCERAPTLEIEAADGAAVAPPAGPRLYHFWATWCAPCVAELPAIARNADRLAAGGLGLYAIANEREWGPLRKAFPAGLPPWVYRLRGPDWPAAQNVHVLPTTLVVDPDGRVTGRREGPLDWDALDPVRPEAVAEARP